MRFAIVLALAFEACRPSPTPVPAPPPPPSEVPAGAYDCERTRTEGIIHVQEPIADEWIAILKHGVGARSVEALDDAIPELKDVRRFKFTPGFAVKIPRSTGVSANSVGADALTKLATDPRVQYVVQNGRKRKASATWGLDRIDQRSAVLDGVYAPGGDGYGVHAFVIDTGIDENEDEFGDRIQEGFSAHSGGPGDREGHGTHVAGTIGSESWGVAKGVKLHPVRVLDENGGGSDADVIAGVDWVTEWCLAHPGVPCVANSSLGGGPSPALDEAYCHSIAARVTHVVAAGNETLPATTSSPARVWQAIVAGATWRDDGLSYFSNYGPLVDLHAPGSGITSVMLGGGLTVMSGTSMASPHVAGAAALYLARHPLATPAEVQAGLITQSTDGVVTHEWPGTTTRMLYVKETE